MDEYSDSWEIKYGKNHGFTIGTKGVKDLNDFYDLNKPNSIGTIFEETQCQLIELMTKHTLTHLDYSFQGKMWNNCN
jgi:predicted PilT family ATPase